MTRIGINGFGRMGRLAFRAAWEREDLSIVHINEIKGGPTTAAHLLEFDSVHGRWPKRWRQLEGSFSVEGPRSPSPRNQSRTRCLGRSSDVDIVLECSGKLLTPEALNPYFERGVRKVIVAAPVKQGALNIVMGVNDGLYSPDEHHIVTAASCTTNCLAPVVKVIHEGIGIRHGVITTIHDVTNTQTMVDLPHKDLRRARSALMSLIPTTTGSATAIGLIYPELQGQAEWHRHPRAAAQCFADRLRVRGGDGPTTVEEVNQLLKAAAESPLQGILAYEERPLVSIDFLNDPHSAIIDALVHDGHRWNPGEDPRLVRQRMGLRESNGRARAEDCGAVASSARAPLLIGRSA